MGIMEFDYEELVRATQSFSASRLLGKGSHGAVYQGILEADDKAVAIKRSSLNADSFKKLSNEISIFSSLRPSSHVISFLGVGHNSANNDDKLLVMELMPNGSLHDLLHVASAPPSWPKRIEIAMQIARAVQFLHESKPLVIHRDIKSANILFDHSWNAKLADFGLAISPGNSLSSTHQTTQPAGTIGYLDPCYTDPNKLSTRNDVFSLGVVLLEIISGRKVMDVAKAPASIVEWAVQLAEKHRIMEICDRRVAFPTYMEGTIRRILSVASRCLSENEERRPSAGAIVMEIEAAYCSIGIERVRLRSSGTNFNTVWSSMFHGFVLIKRRRKLTRQCSAADHVNSDVSSGKVLLKDILLMSLDRVR